MDEFRILTQQWSGSNKLQSQLGLVCMYGLGQKVGAQELKRILPSTI